ncbi:hypothetical protein CLU79DRAFT_766295 [Phycomyces nitens]|nr:hypothetical protein CLU79DRAFT_766295 [Phycomyces nitens]
MWVSFSISTNTRTYTPHPLQKLTMEDSEINPEALDYVSVRCNQLKYVTLFDIRNVEKYRHIYNSEAVHLIFEMTMTNLDTLIFACTDMSYNFEVLPKHHIIRQMDNDNKGLQATRQSPRITWYHLCCDRTNRKEKISKWELGRRDIEFCQRYLEDFDRRKKREKERKDIQKDEYGFVQKRFWKRDLQHGVLVFRFKSVKNYFFRIRDYPETYLWS